MVEAARVIDIAIAGVPPAVERIVESVLKEGLVMPSQTVELIETVMGNKPEKCPGRCGAGECMDLPGETRVVYDADDRSIDILSSPVAQCPFVRFMQRRNDEAQAGILHLDLYKKISSRRSY